MKLFLFTLTYKRGEPETKSLLLHLSCVSVIPFFHQVKATGVCEMKVGACPSPGLGDRCSAGSMPAARSERLRCPTKDLLRCEKQAAPTTNCMEDCPLQRRGRRAVFTLPTVGAQLRRHQPPQGTAANACKEGDHASV